MKKNIYEAPAMEVIKLNVKAQILAASTGEQPGWDPTPADE
jgi:hypothetical protein